MLTVSVYYSVISLNRYEPKRTVRRLYFIKKLFILDSDSGFFELRKSSLKNRSFRIGFLQSARIVDHRELPEIRNNFDGGHSMIPKATARG